MKIKLKKTKTRRLFFAKLYAQIKLLMLKIVGDNRNVSILRKCCYRKLIGTFTKRFHTHHHTRIRGTFIQGR